MGNILQGRQHRRTLDHTGTPASHQLPGTSGSVLSNQELCIQTAESKCPPQGGQCNGNCVHQQTGGSHSQILSNLAIEIWLWCMERKINLHAEHLPGQQNIRADWESRHILDSSDWSLHREVFLSLQDYLGTFTIDLFASRTNAHLPLYCSWRPDPSAICVDALSIPWVNHFPYLFPPLALITCCLQKIKEEQCNVVLITPVWGNQLWYPMLLKCLVGLPILLPPLQDILQGPHGENHPMVLEDHLPLAAWPISGNHTVRRTFGRSCQPYQLFMAPINRIRLIMCLETVGSLV